METTEAPSAQDIERINSEWARVCCKPSAKPNARRVAKTLEVFSLDDAIATIEPARRRWGRCGMHEGKPFTWGWVQTQLAGQLEGSATQRRRSASWGD